MDPLDLLLRCYRAGVRVTLEGAGLRLTGQPCPDDLKAELRTHKAAIIETLATHDVGRPSPIPEVTATVNYVTPCTNSLCPVLGPCRWVVTGQPCPLGERLEYAA